MTPSPLFLSLLLGVQSAMASPPDEGVFFEPYRVAQYRAQYGGNPLFSSLRQKMEAGASH